MKLNYSIKININRKKNNNKKNECNSYSIF